MLLAGSGSGCASCGHQACKPCLNAGPTCELPLGNRNQTYAVLVNGLTPSCGAGLDGLRDKLAQEGFCKVYYGQLCHALWLAQEMRRVYKEVPDARFVVVGYELGGPVAARIARDAADDGLPVDALVLLDPTGKPDGLGGGLRTIVVRSGCTVTPVAYAEALALPDAGHFTLATHTETVGLVRDLLGESAWRVPTVLPGPTAEWTYEFAPPARSTPMPGPEDDPAWHFLLDLPGPKSPPLIPFDPPQTSPEPGKSSAPPWPRKP
jgi:pimeloyl-ACP methyl ester carboxylesterase